MKKLLFQLDTDAIPNTFDTVVAYDGGADHVTVHGGMTPKLVGKMVDGVIFTRAPKKKKNTALFLTGSDMSEGQALLEAVKNHFFADFRVSVMLDSNGSNTTAAAAVAFARQHMSLQGKKAAIKPSDKVTAPYPTRRGWLTSKGRGMSGSRRLSTKKEMATKRNAMVVAKLPLLMSQTKMVLPNSGAIMLRTPMVAIPTQGVL